jgi:hypothetical protein
MGIGKEFWSESNSRIQENKLEFIAENYGTLIKTFRAIKRQNEETYNKKIDAHNEIIKLRDELDQIHQKKKRSTKNEILQIESRIEELEKIREEDDIVLLDGRPLRYNEVVALINNNRYLLSIINEVDLKVRSPLGNIVETGLGFIFKPISKIAGWIGLESIKEIANELPKDIGNFIKE